MPALSHVAVFLLTRSTDSLSPIGVIASRTGLAAKDTEQAPLADQMLSDHQVSQAEMPLASARQANICIPRVDIMERAANLRHTKKGGNRFRTFDSVEKCRGCEVPHISSLRVCINKEFHARDTQILMREVVSTRGLEAHTAPLTVSVCI